MGKREQRKDSQHLSVVGRVVGEVGAWIEKCNKAQIPFPAPVHSISEKRRAF